ncbi:oligopeptide/dipeptide ABC transporter ATP-binding protein [Methanobrevibacter millerae]|uniref:Nickel import system ATP-binding protein NikD n=1 Tax=Methanobrevibacter millerae TaxID=230361 RepID=A0A1G5UUN6_9EURY|nr:ABC transporter ATP-binding protein [Methanobrevibacter millerae]SDA37323.1 peptide/nickel transport system ATP-binding protein [Methanobrevibacter millerae]
MEKVLDVENVSISFIQYTQGLNQRELKVITDLTLDVSEGEILAVLGSSGSGKSLLAHAIFGILPENANLNGKISYKGKELSQEDKEELRGKEIALIPQSVNFLDPLMKISDQAIGHIDSKEEKAEKKIKQREIFEHYNLGPDVDEMYPFQLSGGMARRVLVSTALLSDPKLVVADEPTPGLDEKTVEETLNHFRHMKEDGVGVLLITHDIHAALEVADRIGIFYSGYVIEIAKAEDFSGDGENLLHPYTKSLYKALPANGFELVKGHQPLHGEIQEGCPYYSRCEMRFERCKNERPQLRDMGDKKIRCFKYEEGE